MRSISKAALAGGMALLLGAGLAGTAVAGPWETSVGTAVVAVASDGNRDTDLADSREEQRMARDLYTLFGQTYDAPVFDRIAASEQRHFDAVGTLLVTYGVADPSTGQPVRVGRGDRAPVSSLAVEPLGQAPEIVTALDDVSDPLPAPSRVGSLS